MSSERQRVRVITPAWLMIWLLCAGIMAACTPTGTPVPVATQTLIPATATFTPAPVTPTLPPPTLSGVQALEATPTLTPPAPLLNSDIALPDDFVMQMIDELAADVQLDADQIYYARLEQAAWRDEALGCTFESLFTNPPQHITGFRLTFIAGRNTYVYHTAGTERFVRCDASGTVRDDLLLVVDPVALEMVGMAQRQVAQTLDLPLRRIRLVSVDSRIWQDTSVGCPLEDVTYEPATITGYHIIVAAGDTEYRFNTDTQRLYPCTTP